MKVKEFIDLDMINQIEIYEGNGDELLTKGFAHDIKQNDQDLLDCEIATLVIDPSGNGTFAIRLEDGQRKKMFIRLRQTDKDIRLESIHRNADHTDAEEWGIINMLSEKQLSTLPQEKIDENIYNMEEKMKQWIHEGLCQEYPF